MARKGLPKKYAKMGFKRGWKEYKKAQRRRKRKRKSSRTARTSKKSSKRRRNTMVRRSMWRGASGRILGGMGYGLLREPINRAAKRIPLVGGVADELVLLGIGLAADRYGSKAIKKLGQSATVIESFNLGRNIASGGLNLFGMSGGTSSTTQTTQTTSGATFT